jgi:SAM-dependent methyltransferase
MINETPAQSVAVRIRRLYRGISAYPRGTVGPNNRRLHYARASTYGELTARGIASLVTHTGLAAGDCFVDLGSGSGRVALSVALHVPGITAIGIEIDADRFAIAESIRLKAEARGLIAPTRIRYVHADLNDADLTGGTVYYVCSTCFPIRLLNRLARTVAAMPGVRVFASMHPLSPRLAACFAEHQTVPCPATWASYTDIHLYWVSTRCKKSATK